MFMVTYCFRGHVRNCQRNHGSQSLHLHNGSLSKRKLSFIRQRWGAESPHHFIDL